MVEKAAPESDTLVVEELKHPLVHGVDTMATSGLKRRPKPAILHETSIQTEEQPQEIPKFYMGKKLTPKAIIEPDKPPEQKPSIVAEEKPQSVSEIEVSEKVRPKSKVDSEKKPDIKLAPKVERKTEEQPGKVPEIIGNDKTMPKQTISPEAKPTVKREASKVKPIDTSVVEKAKKEEEEKGVTSSPGGSVRSPTGDLALSPTAMSPTGASSGPSSEIFTTSGAGTNVFTETLENALKSSITKKISSSQVDILKEFKAPGAEGAKAKWSKTHFIFMVDCSATMSGARWDSVTLGYDACLQKLKPVTDVYVSSFSFDGKVNPFCREKPPVKAAVTAKELPFTGKGRSFKRALDYAIKLMERFEHKDYLHCMLLLASGAGGPSQEQIDRLKTMRKVGIKFVFYTISCETEDEKEIIELTKALDGEHYKLDKAEASRIVFYNILDL